MASQNVHFPAATDPTVSVFSRVSAEQAGWQYLNLVALRLETDNTFGITIDDYEYVAVILGGVCDIHTSRGDFLEVGRRPDVFTGMPYAIYMPRQTEFEIQALSDDFAMVSAWAPTTKDNPIKLMTPQDSKVAVFGGGSTSYQVNTIFEVGEYSESLSVREMYIPGGNWAPYPPHKHDTDVHGKDGLLQEAALEEINFFKMERPHGFALQRVTDYTEIDQTLTARHNDCTAIAKGYHTIASSPNSVTYVLNVTAGANKSSASADDPRYGWVRETWLNKDSRLPIVDHGMEPYVPPAETE